MINHKAVIELNPGLLSVPGPVCHAGRQECGAGITKKAAPTQWRWAATHRRSRLSRAAQLHAHRVEARRALTRGKRLIDASPRTRGQKLLTRNAKNSCIRSEMRLCRERPISHVPVAVCRSVGIRTRGRTAA